MYSIARGHHEKEKNGHPQSVFVLIVLFLLSVAIKPVSAATIRWDLNGVEGAGGHDTPVTISGFFNYETASQSPCATCFPSYSFSVSSPLNTFPSFTLTESNSYVRSGSYSGISIMNDNATAKNIKWVGLGTSGGSFSGSTGLLLSLSPSTSSFVLVNQWGITSVNSLKGQLVGTNISPVPLPAAFPLFGTGCVALAGLSRFRKSKKKERNG